MDASEDVPGRIECSECGRQVSGEVALAERWTYWSDGTGDPLPYCPECAAREFGGVRGSGSTD